MVKKFFAGFLLVFILVVSVFLFWVSQNYQVPVLMYHEVSPTDVSKSNIVSPESFSLQMEFLKRKRYRVISFEHLIDLLESGSKISRKTVVITFDDGRENLYDYAFPVLKELQLPAIVFMPSGHIGKDGYLSLAQMWEMQDSGLVMFGSHTVDHAYLPDLSDEEQAYQLFASKDDLESNLGVAVDYFAYPIGGFNQMTKDILKKAGYRAAVTTNRGFDREQKDLFELKRVSMRDRDTVWYILVAKFSGYYNLFRKSVKPF